MCGKTGTLIKTYSDKFIADLESSVFVGSSSLNDFGDIDTVVSRNVLISHSTSYTEA